MSSAERQYLDSFVQRISTIIYNTSQSDSPYNDKWTILRSLKGMVDEYNEITGSNIDYGKWILERK